MNRAMAAQAYKLIAEGFSLLAVACETESAGVADSPSPAPALAPLRPAGLAAAPAATAPAVDTGGLCPAHGARFQAGNSGGYYCPSKATEPAWSNRKGYCTITPESAGQWLAIHAAAQ